MISAAGNALALEEYTHKADSDQYADDREMERANLKVLLDASRDGSPDLMDERRFRSGVVHLRYLIREL